MEGEQDVSIDTGLGAVERLACCPQSNFAKGRTCGGECRAYGFLPMGDAEFELSAWSDLSDQLQSERLFKGRFCLIDVTPLDALSDAAKAATDAAGAGDELPHRCKPRSNT